MAVCGIYKLEFKNCAKVYIGQSINIEDRYEAHITSMKKGSHTKKLQEAFNSYGYPSLFLEKLCKRSDLDVEEAYFVKKYNSISEGFNYSKVLTSNLAGSKFSKDQVLQVFDLLVDSTHTHLEISKIAGTSLALVNSISSGQSHSYLSETYPERYTYLMNSVGLRSTAKYRGIVYPRIQSPTGEVFTVTNVSAFAREHGLHRSNLNQVLRGHTHSVTGWSLERNKK